MMNQRKAHENDKAHHKNGYDKLISVFPMVELLHFSNIVVIICITVVVIKVQALNFAIGFVPVSVLARISRYVIEIVY